MIGTHGFGRTHSSIIAKVTLSWILLRHSMLGALPRKQTFQNELPGKTLPNYTTHSYSTDTKEEKYCTPGQLLGHIPSLSSLVREKNKEKKHGRNACTANCTHPPICLVFLKLVLKRFLSVLYCTSALLIAFGLYKYPLSQSPKISAFA